MKLLFKQRFFSWFDSYDIYDEAGNTMFVVKGELAWGHLLRIYDTNGNEVGYIKEKILTWLPKFEMYIGDRYAGCISKEFTLFKPKFNIDYNGWHVDGDWFEWDYTILNSAGQSIASVSKELWNWTDTYVIDVHNPQDALYALMLVLAIDAEKCSRKDKGDSLNPSTYIPIIVLFIILYILFRNRRAVVARQIIKKRKMEGNIK